MVWCSLTVKEGNMAEETKKDGKKMIDKLDLTFKGNNMLSFTGSSVLDGKTQWSGYGTFYKVVDK